MLRNDRNEPRRGQEPPLCCCVCPLARAGELQCGTVPSSGPGAKREGPNQQNAATLTSNGLKNKTNSWIWFSRSSWELILSQLCSSKLHGVEFKRNQRHAFPCVWGARLGSFFITNLFILNNSIRIHEYWEGEILFHPNLQTKVFFIRVQLFYLTPKQALLTKMVYFI